MKKNLMFITGIIVLISLVTLIFAQNETNDTSLCGNLICDNNESLSCPFDCNLCSGNLECDDGNPCTIDACDGTPKDCIHTQKDCSDNNPATMDKCIEGECKNQYTTECINGDGYCPSGCNNIDSDCPEKDSCNSINDCNDANPCTEDLCEGKPKKCNHLSNNGIRKDNMYCYGGSWKDQKIDGENCDEDYECVSNSCSDGNCSEKEISWLGMYLPWLHKILKALRII